MVGGKLGGIEYVEVKDGMLIGLEVALCTSEFEINDQLVVGGGLTGPGGGITGFSGPPRGGGGPVGVKLELIIFAY